MWYITKGGGGGGIIFGVVVWIPLVMGWQFSETSWKTISKFVLIYLVRFLWPWPHLQVQQGCGISGLCFSRKYMSVEVFPSWQLLIGQWSSLVSSKLCFEHIKWWWYTADPIHRGPLLREIQYIKNRQWTPNLPRAKKKNKKKKLIVCLLFYLIWNKKKTD